MLINNIRNRSKYITCTNSFMHQDDPVGSYSRYSNVRDEEMKVKANESVQNQTAAIHMVDLDENPVSVFTI